MRLTISISQKIALAFGILTFLSVLFIYLSNKKLSEISELTDRIVKQEIVSEHLLDQLTAIVRESTLLSKSWAYADKDSDTPDKRRLKQLHNSRYPLVRNQLLKFKGTWDKNEKDAFTRICSQIEDTLFSQQKNIMTALNNYDAYSSTKNDYLLRRLISQKGSIPNTANLIQKRISVLQDNFEKSTSFSLQTLEKEQFNAERLFLLATILLILFGIGLTYITIVLFVFPIHKIRNILSELSKGILSNTIESNRRDGIGEIITNLNTLTTNLSKTAEFSLELGKGNYDIKFDTFSKEDVLNNSLLELRNSLESATKEATERRKKEEIQNWITNGLANFADILRQNNDDFGIVGNNILRYLVDYMKINQGGIFVYNDDDEQNPHLDLVSMYAYNREKYTNKRITPGEGLVGTCLIEKETIYLKEIPDSYLEITSGLGKANPRNILIVPLKIEENILGVIEIASFQLFEKHEIEFVEKIAESIASTLQTVRINKETQKLLLHSKEQAEAMKTQEEEMRQNIEELKATQEEAARKEAQLENEINQAHIELDLLRGKAKDREEGN